MSYTSVLYLTYDGLSDPLGQSQILPYVIELSMRQWQFTIISFEKKKRFEKSELEIRKICGHNSIRWIPLIYHKKPPILSTVFDIWLLWKTVKREQIVNQFRIVHCRSYISSLIGLRAKKKWGVKFIFDMRGFWADERVEGGIWNLRNPIFRLVYRFFKNKEKLFLERADHIISLTHNAKKEIESWKIRNAPITVIPTCVDLDLFDLEKIKKEDQARLRKSLGLTENDFVLLYLGSWGTWYLTEKMLEFFSMVKQVKSNAKFLIVSPDKIDLSHFSDKESIIITSSSRQWVPVHISLADLSICFIKPSFSKKASSATKFGELMAMEVAIVANGEWGDVDWFAQTETGILKVDLQKMALPESSHIRRQPNSRVFAQNYFSLDKAVAAYEKIYKSLEGA